MKRFNRYLIGALALGVLAVTALQVSQIVRSRAQVGTPGAVSTVRFGVSPFQDTYLPVLGKDKGWYAEEGLDVQFSVLGWTEVMEALSAGEIDVAINNESSVIATHERNPEIIYWYALNPFDNGFALMVRPGGGLRTLEEIKKTTPDHAQAVLAAAAQLKGKSVVTTGKTDMEQGVAAAARRGGLDFRRDIRIIDLNPDEGLAAFLRGEGDAFIGGIPQRTRAKKEGMLEMLTGADLGPPPINGIVTTKTFARDHEDELLRLLRVWFRIVNYVNGNMDEAANSVITALNARTAANLTVADFKLFWNNYEHYPASPAEVDSLILQPSGRNYWVARWTDTNDYFLNVTKVISAAVNAEDAMWMSKAHSAYVAKYGNR